jgi:hypothetical protein
MLNVKWPFRPGSAGAVSTSRNQAKQHPLPRSCQASVCGIHFPRIWVQIIFHPLHAPPLLPPSPPIKYVGSHDANTRWLALAYPVVQISRPQRLCHGINCSDRNMHPAVAETPEGLFLNAGRRRHFFISTQMAAAPLRVVRWTFLRVQSRRGLVISGHPSMRQVRLVRIYMSQPGNDFDNLDNSVRPARLHQTPHLATGRTHTHTLAPRDFCHRQATASAIIRFHWGGCGSQRLAVYDSVIGTHIRGVCGAFLCGSLTYFMELK